MNTMKPSGKKLIVKRQTLRTLASEELDRVHGGLIVAMVPPKNNCTGRLSGCISQV